MSPLGLAVSLGAAAFLGFAAHRGSICNVKAVMEVMTSRRGYMLTSFLKTILWAFAVVLAATWITLEGPPLSPGYWPSTASLIGGFVFGLGAAVNGGCAFSTLNKLGSGDFGTLGTLVGFVAGLFLAFGVTTELEVYADSAPSGLPLNSRLWTVLLSLLTLLWIVSELRRLWARRDRSQSNRDRILANRYRLSTAALIIGLCGGLLYVLYGPWVYTAGLTQAVRWSLELGDAPEQIGLWLFAAVLFGIIVSAIQRKALRARIGSVWMILRHLLGGTMMGAGAALVPGGNDHLVLSAIPLWLPHAVPAYLAMLVGIATVLAMHRWMTGDLPRLACSGDVCRED